MGRRPELLSQRQDSGCSEAVWSSKTHQALWQYRGALHGSISAITLPQTSRMILRTAAEVGSTCPIIPSRCVMDWTCAVCSCAGALPMLLTRPPKVAASCSNGTSEPASLDSFRRANTIRTPCFVDTMLTSALGVLDPMLVHSHKAHPYLAPTECPPEERDCYPPSDQGAKNMRDLYITCYFMLLNPIICYSIVILLHFPI